MGAPDQSYFLIRQYGDAIALAHRMIVNKKITYEEVLGEYRYALGIWTETKALYASDGPEVFQATLQLEELEKRLENFRRPVSLLAA